MDIIQQLDKQMQSVPRAYTQYWCLATADHAEPFKCVEAIEKKGACSLQLPVITASLNNERCNRISEVDHKNTCPQNNNM